MVGQLVLRREKGRFQVEEARLGPLPVLRAAVYQPEGLAPWRLRRRLRRVERALARMGAGRVILGADFPYGDRLTLLCPVDPLPFWRGCADVLALGALETEGIPLRRGRVALSAPRLCRPLMAAAERLCPQVRDVLIDVPGGADYARYLQARFGLPVAPPGLGADVTAAFGPGGGRWGRSLELHGRAELGGLTVWARDIALPGDCGGQVLALLWERGLVRREELLAGEAGACGFFPSGA